MKTKKTKAIKKHSKVSPPQKNAKHHTAEIIDRRANSISQAEKKSWIEKTPDNTGIPDHLKASIETLSGMDMSDVRVQRNSPKPARLNALAYTQGTEIHLGPGQERLLPHEAWHAVQQKQGRVKPTSSISGIPLNENQTLEREADRKGATALQMYPRAQKLSKVLSSTAGNSVAQKNSIMNQANVQRVRREDFSNKQDIKDFINVKNIIKEYGRISYLDIERILENISIENMKSLMELDGKTLRKLPWSTSVLDILINPNRFIDRPEEQTETIQEPEIRNIPKLQLGAIKIIERKEIGSVKLVSGELSEEGPSVGMQVKHELYDTENNKLTDEKKVTEHVQKVDEKINYHLSVDTANGEFTDFHHYKNVTKGGIPKGTKTILQLWEDSDFEIIPKSGYEIIKECEQIDTDHYSIKISKTPKDVTIKSASAEAGLGQKQSIAFEIKNDGKSWRVLNK